MENTAQKITKFLLDASVVDSRRILETSLFPDEKGELHFDPSSSSKGRRKKKKNTSLGSSDVYYGTLTDKLVTKLSSLSSQAATQIEKVEGVIALEVADSKKVLKEKEEALEEAKKVYLEHSQNLDKLTKLFGHSQRILVERHVRDMLEAYKAMVLVVYETKIAMAKEAASKGFKPDEWDIPGWEETAADLNRAIKSQATLFPTTDLGEQDDHMNLFGDDEDMSK